MVVVSRGRAVHLAYRGGGGGGCGGGFPSALMGYIAYIRQIYLDAEHYKLVKEAYAQRSARHGPARI